MLKFSLYLIVFAIVFFWGLAVGASNSALVDFDFLFMKSQMSLSSVFAIGILIGIALGIYISLLFCLKVLKNARNAKSEVKRMKKQEHDQISSVQKKN